MHLLKIPLFNPGFCELQVLYNLSLTDRKYKEIATLVYIRSNDGRIINLYRIFWS